MTQKRIQTLFRSILIAWVSVACMVVWAPSDADCSVVAQTRTRPQANSHNNPARRPTSQRAPASLGRSDPASNTSQRESRSHQAPAFPYEVATVASRTPIRSGPGDNAYATDDLPPNTTLQVWRHEPDGWLAIRPPAGSFSLIESKHLKPTDSPDIYIVSTDRAKAWIGTAIDDEHVPISQVRLKAAERVAVISTLVIEEESETQTWFQIEPPAGEFRFVHVDDLKGTRRPPATAAQIRRTDVPQDAPVSGYLPRHTAQTTGPAYSPFPSNVPTLELEPHAGFPTEERNAWRAAQFTTPQTALETDPHASPLSPHEGMAGQPTMNNRIGHADSQGPESQWIVSPVSESNDQAGIVRTVDNLAPAAPGEIWDQAVNRLRQDPVANAIANKQAQAGATGSPTPLVSGDGLDWNQRLAWVQNQLLQQTALPAPNWNLLPLLEQCRALWHAAPSQPQQAAAAEVGIRIEQLIQMQQSRPNTTDLSASLGYRSVLDPPLRVASNGNLPGNFVGTTSPATDSNNPFVLPPGAVPPTNVATTSIQDPNLAFDAVGYLKELIMARGQKTNEYVLQDENGKSICHLTAQGGVNLQIYLDQKVGVLGTKGIHGKLNLPHVSVERIYRIQ